MSRLTEHSIFDSVALDRQSSGWDWRGEADHDATPAAPLGHRFLLTIENPATGYIKVLSFPTRFDRGLQMIALSAQPLVLRALDCE